MIKFFRKIRQKLLEQNRVSKYLIYAFGEIILVVIGILIALQINNWNEAKKQKAYENNLLIQLKKDLEFNIKDIKLNISLQEMCINSCSILIEHIEKKETYNDSLLVHFSQSALWTKAILNKGAYSTLTSSGLDIISNYELRDLIFNIYEGDLVWIHHMEDVVYDQIEDFRLHKAENYFKKWEATELVNGKLGTGEVIMLDYEKLLTNNSFQYFLRGVKANSEILKKVVENYLIDHQKAIQLINQHLETND